MSAYERFFQYIFVSDISAMQTYIDLKNICRDTYKKQQKNDITFKT